MSARPHATPSGRLARESRATACNSATRRTARKFASSPQPRERLPGDDVAVRRAASRRATRGPHLPCCARTPRRTARRNVCPRASSWKHAPLLADGANVGRSPRRPRVTHTDRELLSARTRAVRRSGDGHRCPTSSKDRRSRRCPLRFRERQHLRALLRGHRVDAGPHCGPAGAVRDQRAVAPLASCSC